VATPPPVATDAARLRHSEDEFAVIARNATATCEHVTTAIKTAVSQDEAFGKRIAEAGARRKLRSIGFAKRVTLYDTELSLPRHQVALTDDVQASADNQGNRQVVQGWVFRNTNDRREMMLHVEWPDGYEAVHWERNDKAVTGSIVQPREVHEMAAAINQAAAAADEVRWQKQAVQEQIREERLTYLAELNDVLDSDVKLAAAHILFLKDLHDERTRLDLRGADKRFAKRVTRELDKITKLWKVLHDKSLQAQSMVEANRQEQHVPGPDPDPAEMLEPEAPDELTADDEMRSAFQDDARAPVPDLLDVLRRLGELHAAGFLTDEEFEAKKKSILERL